MFDLAVADDSSSGTHYAMIWYVVSVSEAYRRKQETWKLEIYKNIRSTNQAVKNSVIYNTLKTPGSR